MTEPVYDGRSDHLHQVGYFGGIYARKFGPVSAGFVHDGHTHYVDHVTFLMSGRVRVRYSRPGVEEKSAVFVAPMLFEIRADTCHEIEALEDGTAWSCVFARPEDGSSEPIPFTEERPRG